jgi:hypothetical protein
MAESNTDRVPHEPFRILDLGKKSRKQIRRLKKGQIGA